ncbi:MAG: chemotaxis protein CheB, partial [Anaerolineae bacterium]|nr:chemotaxis protein CheB [Anaerolineae bacterium]
MAKKQSPPSKTKTGTAPPSPAFPIVGIGASAGGLEAFEQFFTHMPANSGIAFVLVQHLDPNRKSMLVELIQRYTRMTVYQVEDHMRIEPNGVYIIPPNRDMKLENQMLYLFEPTAPRGSRLAIDFFFRSLAAEQKERAIGIVLSGTGSDGTLGIQTIKGEGGMVM